jgi:hypothetical protein
MRWHSPQRSQPTQQPQNPKQQNNSHRRKLAAAALVSAAGAAAGAVAWWYCEGERRRREGEEAQRSAMLDTLASIIEGDRPLHAGSGGLAGGGGGGGGADPAAAAGADPAAAASAFAAAAGHAGDASAGDPLDASLARHFESIQSLSDRQALESLLPRLRGVLSAATDIEPLKERIRAMSAAEQQQQQQQQQDEQEGQEGAEANGGTTAAAANGRAATSAAAAAEAKLAAWRQLACLCFTRAAGACWLVPLLDLLVRMKLHVVARHMYLESKLPGLAAAAGAGNGAPALNGGSPFGAAASTATTRTHLPPRLSDRAKEEFFRSDYFVEVGAVGLLRKLSAAVEAALAGVDLAAEVTAADVERLMVAVHARFEASFERCEDLWHGYLLPPGLQPVARAAAAANGGRGGGAGDANANLDPIHPASAHPPPVLSPVEAAMVDELNAELRDVLSDYRFVEALRAAVRHTSRASGAYIAARAFGSGGSAAAMNVAVETTTTPGGGAGEDAVAAAAQQQAAASQPPAQRPLAFVVPVVAKSSQLLFDEAHRCTRGISSLQAVLSLCASVFSFGPHIA